ncbi:bromodomain-containing protein 9 [Cocos nucifera]|uniref:Bromodomain-containing protein 9 n=1 Tax=Cocos nucifera TaxID=13894 RepID=A0A8K0IVA4_COCNU|nr:bromodomain-containing protein 9 [Cocos nucifera]
MMAKAAAAKKRGRPRKKRKGWPPCPDPPLPVVLRRPPPPPSPAPEPPRRTLRPRRRRRPLHDFTDDEFDDEEEEGEEEEGRRRRRKLKLVLKLPNVFPSRRDERCSDSPVLASRSRRNPSSSHMSSSLSSATSSSYVDDDDQEEVTIKPPKKRRTEGCDDGVGSDGSGDQERGGKRELRRCSNGSALGTPLPERKTLEAILDKLQKKDTYGAFAEPVDPEELPDYHEVIEHPMDFGTVRKKLASNAYRFFEQFEDDIFLICSNAMQYNAPDTIYFRQARLIQDMARQKFQKLRVDGKCAETAGKSEEKINFNPHEKKPLMKSLSRTAQELLGSDISSAATLASTGDAGTALTTAQANGVEAPVILNGFAEGSSSLGESKSEKAEELSAKSSPAQLARKLFVVDENRRATYDNISEQQPMLEPESVFDVFESETKQLVAVGLHTEYSYARSLARFCAFLGPIAWEIASKRIEKALPAGVKFGPGWLGEFKPLQTPVLSLKKNKQQLLGLNSNFQFKLPSRKNKEAKDASQATQICEPKDIRLGLKSQVTTGLSNKAPNLVKESDCHRSTIELKQGLSHVTSGTQPSISSATGQQQKDKLTVNSAKTCSSVLEQVRVCHSTSVSSIPVETALQRTEYHSEAVTTRSPEIIFWHKNQGQPGNLKQAEAVAFQSRNEVLSMDFRALSNGKAAGNSDSNRLSTTLGFIPKQQPGTAGNFLAIGSQEQRIHDHSRLMGLPGQISNQLNSSNLGIDASKHFSSAVLPSGRENMNAAAAAARAWMSIGASAECKAVAGRGLPNNQVGSASFNNFAWRGPDSPSGIHEDSKTRPVPYLFQQSNQVASDESKVRNKELVIFPQLVGTDLSRFHGQSRWQGLVPHTEQKQNRDMCPPDLNIGFQLPGSPVHQSSGMLKDSQQPDLALQL